MKTLYESILDDENILINKANNNIAAEVIYNKIINKEQLTKIDLDLINNKIGVYEVNRNELRELINVINREKKYHKLSLNWLDTSRIDDMSFIFKWSQFNGDISKWDVSKVENMDSMFYNSQFNGDISKWDVSNVEDMDSMFMLSQFNGDISKWDVSKVKDMSFMFNGSEFNGDISKWKISSKCDTYNIFLECPIKDKYKPKNIK
jgi:surface protein